MKNVFMYIIVIAIVAIGVWLFMRKGNTGTSSLYETTSPSVTPVAEVSASATPIVSASPAGKVITTVDGLQYQDEVIGTGAIAKAGQMVVVNYTGMFTDGSKFDSNVDPKFNHVEPFSFQLGAGQVIKGWDEGVAGMKIGGKRKLVVPASIGYGAQANGPIPANSVLVFEVELLGIK